MQKYKPPHHPHDELRLEYVTTSVGFDDILDVTLGQNHRHFDTVTVVTSHADTKTQQVAAKHGANCIQTDLFGKDGRLFNKGAAINSGMGRFRYHGWRAHLDADIIVPDSFRRILFDYTHLEKWAIYGADRINVQGLDALNKVLGQLQHSWGYFIGSNYQCQISPRYCDILRGYVPIGYFQLWHASAQKPYPHSLGSAEHDDVLFAEQWPRHARQLLPTIILWHLLTEPTRLGQNWEGRTTVRL